MGSTTIFVRLLDEAVDCWRPVDAIKEGADSYRIVGPDPDPAVERWQFQAGEVGRCQRRDGQLVAVQLLRRSASDAKARGLAHLGRFDQRRTALAEAVGRAIDVADPIGLLSTGAPADEYSAEVGTILTRLVDAHGPDDVVNIVHEEFCRWFGSDAAGPRQEYESVATGIWEAVLEHRRTG